ncbi:uncharacterized protein EV420DRAFT_811202 [Desarmillaria tabescens]|uniref:Uncharacterized protein n=1 Tax=Armillaria tabescens TaxID=1929756 RepID=A0AA39NI89_ARMTA|nr:uncharacterized protein EV420DRAFT_811202 [Desarmillaria tabescens]KAK0466131.1 hypothetical protein EV420DRAFT_811202 [Desarmillaria tabescens]
MVIVITLLYIVTTINFALAWLSICSLYINHGQSIWTKYQFYTIPTALVTLGSGISATICTILADSTIIWRCWMVCGQQWLTILLPVLFLISATACNTVVVYKNWTTPFKPYILGNILYSSFILATTLWCTLLVIYHIVTVTQAGNNMGGGLRTYRHVIELLVESAALHAVFSILFTVLYACSSPAFWYFSVLAGVAKGVAPTLLVGRIAAGHARPDDSWQGSMISGSLHFRTRSGGQNSQQDSMDDTGVETGIYETTPMTQLEDDHCDNKKVDNPREDIQVEVRLNDD